MPQDQLHDTSDNFSLTARQARAVGYLLTCRTVGEAAEKVGVSERTIYSWMKLDGFRGALRAAGRDVIENTSRLLAQGQENALEALSTLIADSNNAGVRRAAAVDWLNLSLKYRDMNDTETRLAELEKVVFDDEAQ